MRALLAVLIGAFALALGAPAIPTAQAATITLSTCNASDLISALNTANADAAPDTIALKAGCTYGLNAVDNTDPSTGANGLPVIATAITLNGNGATISSSVDNIRILQVNSGGALTLNQLVLSNASSAGNGGAVLNNGTLTITSSTLAGNHARQNGGALYNGAGGVLTIVNSTLNTNSAVVKGGGIYNAGAANVTNTTLALNAASTAGGIATGIKPITMSIRDSIVATRSGGAVCAGAFTSASTNNMATDSSCGASFSSVTWVALKLGALAIDGGVTPTVALIPGSPAIDAGNDTTCAAAPVNGLDQRSIPRPLDGDADGSAVCDIGAYELDLHLQPGPDFTVNSAANTFDGFCTYLDCTLRDAITAANRLSPGVTHTITLAVGATYEHNSVDNTGFGANALPRITGNIAIQGQNSTLVQSPSRPRLHFF